MADNEFLTNLCEPYDEAVKNEIIMIMVENDEPLKHCRFWPNKVLVFRLIKDDLSPEVGFFRAKPGSHRTLSHRKIHDIPDENIYLKANEALVLDGDMVIKWPESGGGLCMMKVITKT